MEFDRIRAAMELAAPARRSSLSQPVARADRMRCRPLVVDLDGTFIRSDVVIESGFASVKAAPHRFYERLPWLGGGGKAGLKAGVVETRDRVSLAAPALVG